MALRNIRVDDDPCLTKVCRKVDRFDAKLASLLDDMFDTMYDADGVGLAAPQIGVAKRVAVVNVDEGYFEFINPVFVWQKGEQNGPEGCLSVRGKQGMVTRPSKVKIIFNDRYGQKYALVAKNFFARACCHEFDHLDGIIYTDKATDIRSDEEEA